MKDSTKSNLINKIKTEYNKKLKDLEFKLALKHKELNQIENELIHDRRKIDHSNVGKLRSKKAEINADISFLQKEIKKINKEKIRKLKKL
ncbi:MAG: hypothetical protein ACFFG0_50245 [Candidatus Thorarchaeota archaeon]